MNCLQEKLIAAGAQHSLGISLVTNTSLVGYIVTETHSSVTQLSLPKLNLKSSNIYNAFSMNSQS